MSSSPNINPSSDAATGLHRIVKVRCQITFTFEMEVDTESLSDERLSDDEITTRMEQQLVDAPFDMIPQEGQIQVETKAEII